MSGTPVCFCLPEYEGSPPAVPCQPPKDACSISSCGPNTQCTRLPNGIAKCTCLPGFIESPNTIRGCVEPKNPCEPFPCGFGASCDVQRTPVCYCPESTVGNPFKQCSPPAIAKELCRPGPCGGEFDFFSPFLHQIFNMILTLFNYHSFPFRKYRLLCCEQPRAVLLSSRIRWRSIQWLS